MFNHPKKMKAAKKWRSRAMIVDIRKIKLIIIQGETANIIENKSEEEPADPSITTISNFSSEDEFADNKAILAEVFGTSVSIEPVDY